MGLDNCGLGSFVLILEVKNNNKTKLVTCEAENKIPILIHFNKIFQQYVTTAATCKYCVLILILVCVNIYLKILNLKFYHSITR